MILLWLCIGVLTAAVLFLLIRIFLMRKSIGEISEELRKKIETDTNTRIHLSSGDRRLRKLAADLNGQLKILRAERLRYQQGDRELKEKGIHPRIHICEKKIHRDLNKNALLRIFSNVLSNAVKYSDGDLTISLSEQGEIRFQNHSAGLDEIRTGRLFDRFYTVETADGESAGLGLSIAKTLTERMDGRILAEYHGGIVTIEIIFREP